MCMDTLISMIAIGFKAMSLFSELLKLASLNYRSKSRSQATRPSSLPVSKLQLWNLL